MRAPTSGKLQPVSDSLVRFQAHIRDVRRSLRISETTWLFFLAMLAGLVAGFGAIAFNFLISFVQWLAIGTSAGKGPVPFILSGGAPAWRVLLAPAAGGLLVGPLIYFLAREAKGHGVPAVVRAVHERSGRIDPIIALVKLVASALTLGTGGSLGREGPVIQIGAAFGSATGQLLGVTPRQLKMLAAGGAAGGLAAMFNAPLGGAFFALEVVVGSFAMDAFGPVVVASVAATVVSRAILGNNPNIAVSHYELLHSYELAIYVALGLACGAVAVVFTRAVALSTALFERVRLPEWLKPSSGGAAVGLIAVLLTPRVLGNGYATIETILKNEPLEVLFVALLGLKLVATCLSLGSGGSGGVFGPSLYLGAVLGALVGKIAGFVLPVAPPGAYALVGMAAFVAGAMHAPVSMVLMLFEMTNDYQIVLPLLIASSIASVVAKKIYVESIDTVLDARAGLHVHKNVEEMALHAVRVDEAASRSEDAVVLPTARLDAVIQRFLKVKTGVLAVCTEGGKYLGVILLEDVRGSVIDGAIAASSVIAQDVLRTDVPTLAPDQPLTRAIDVFHGIACDALPVVSGPEPTFHGFLREGDIVSAYRRSILKSELQSTLFVSQGKDAVAERVDLPPGIEVATVASPPWLVGKTLAEVQVRTRYGILVLGLEVLGEDGRYRKRLPDPAIPIAANERLVVLGPVAALNALREGMEPPPVTRETALALSDASQRLSKSGGA
jgi:CIC family chloride channel protein